jgi:hypothetical protein
MKGEEEGGEKREEEKERREGTEWERGRGVLYFSVKLRYVFNSEDCF